MAVERQMRVLHVTDRSPGSPLAGGAEAYVERLLAAQQDRGHDVHLFTADGVRTSAVLDLWNPFTRRALHARLRSLQPEVVHVHNVMRELSPSVLGATGGTPTVMTMHDLRAFAGGEHTGDALRRTVDTRVLAPILRRAVRRHVGRVVAVSEAMRDDLASQLPGVTYVPPPGRRPAVSTQPPSRSQTVLYVGRLDADKGVAVLAEAFERLAAACAGARLVVLGDGSLRGQLEELSGRHPARVAVRGRVPAAEVSAEMATARLVVVPSVPRLRREGLPLAAVDAAMHGRPLVTSDDPGAAEVARRVGGVTVAAEDADALAAAITSYLDEPRRADADGTRAAAAAAAYDPAAVAEQLDAVYRGAR